MLNTPNEWHNEEYTEDEKAPENFANGEYDGGYSDDEYNEEDEYVDDNEDDNKGGNSKNKIIIIAVIAAVALIVIIGGIIGFTAMKNKNSSGPDQQPQYESMDDQNMDVSQNENGDEISIDVESEDGMMDENQEGNPDENQEWNPDGNQEWNPDENQEGNPEGNPEENQGDGNQSNGNENEQWNNDNGNENASNGLDVPQEQRPPLTAFGTHSSGDGSVSVSIGDIGRQNPFKPNIEQQKLSAPATATKEKAAVKMNYSFDVIEPPELGVESLDLARLMQTKVTGILYDNIKPSAIVNIDGSDQLVSIGDNVGGFEITSITKNKVVIRDGNNVFRASVGQPLNAEKVVNPVEISNLETKFAGSTKH